MLTLLARKTEEGKEKTGTEDLVYRVVFSPVSTDVTQTFVFESLIEANP